jgi:hypothetical protein
MPLGIDKSDWDRVHQMACDVANAAISSDDDLMASKNAAMLDLLATLRHKYGDNPAIIATIADYLDDPTDRRAHYMKALSIATEQGNDGEIEEIKDSLRTLDQECRDEIGQPTTPPTLRLTRRRARRR